MYESLGPPHTLFFQQKHRLCDAVWTKSGVGASGRCLGLQAVSVGRVAGILGKNNVWWGSKRHAQRILLMYAQHAPVTGGSGGLGWHGSFHRLCFPFVVTISEGSFLRLNFGIIVLVARGGFFSGCQPFSCRSESSNISLF